MPPTPPITSFQDILTQSLEELVQTFPDEGRAFVLALATELDAFVTDALASGATDTAFVVRHARARFDQLAAIHLAQLRDRLKEKTKEIWLAVVRTAITLLVPAVPAAGALVETAGQLASQAVAATGKPSWLKQG